MNIIFFAHPNFTNSKSMPRYTKYLSNGMRDRGHNIEIWSPKPFFYNLTKSNYLKKWFGYLDQYIIFPLFIIRRIYKNDKSTLYVFTDNALGPWIPLVKKKPHIIHCHDFMAQLSAIGKLKYRNTRFSGKIYQYFIRKGLKKAKYFISISNNTKKDLKYILKYKPIISEVVHNGFHSEFYFKNRMESRTTLGTLLNLNLSNGYILHVGGNQWYKNRKGVIKIYNKWRELDKNNNLPLVLLGSSPTKEILVTYNESKYTNDIHFITNVDDEMLNIAYSGASVLLFPSIYEGFGWPIAEAMKCGCLIITTDKEPMTEIASENAFYIPQMPIKIKLLEQWSIDVSKILNSVLHLESFAKNELIKKAITKAEVFNSNSKLDQIEIIYKNVLTHFN